MLRTHPNIYLPEKKELHYFNSYKFHQGRENEFDNYHLDFINANENQICGEATPAYIYTPSVPTKVKQYNPKMKWIIILRHPVSRAYSQWNMQRKRGIEELSFNDALKKEEDRLNSNTLQDKKRFAYLHRSQYSNQILRLYQNFGPNQCHFLTSETLKNDTSKVVSDICSFLKIPHFPIDLIKNNIGHYSEFLDSSKNHLMTDFLREDIKSTEKLTGLDLQHWLVSKKTDL